MVSKIRSSLRSTILECKPERAVSKRKMIGIMRRLTDRKENMKLS